MGFFEKINQLDTQLLLRLNDNFTDFWDATMYVGTDKLYWIPLYLLIFYMIIKNKGRESFLIIGMLVLTLFLNDTVSTLIKNLVERMRPSHDPRTMFDVHLVNGYRGGLYSFVSSHAANSFGLALFLSLLVRQASFSISIFIWAFFHSYTRIYLGVHYPCDILFGSILGLIIGYSGYKLYYILRSKFHFLQAAGLDQKRLSHTASGFDRNSVFLVIFMLIFSFVFLFITAGKIIDFMP